MTVEGRHFTWTIPAGEDLDDLEPGKGDLYRAIGLNDGRKAPDGLRAGGILLYGGKSGDHVTLGYLGVMKFAAGGDIAKGERLTVDSDGRFVRATPGTYVVGRCLVAAVTEGGIGIGAFNFATISYFNESEEVEIEA